MHCRDDLLFPSLTHIVAHQWRTELNNMTGSLPSELGILTSLEVLDLSYNTYLGGELPFELCDLTNLKRIEIGDTAFTGNLPSCLPTALTDLRELIAPDVGLSGPFPDLCEMSKLTLIVLMKNQFTGALPTCNWPELTFLGLSDNMFEVRARIVVAARDAGCDGWMEQWMEQ
jgi:hypothetical protein